MRRAAIIVLDGVGIGPAIDSEAYGDTGSDTLGNVARAVGGLALPRLEALGLGRCAQLSGVAPLASPGAAHGVCEPASPGKDSTTGHWEICGLILDRAFPTYPSGFPPEVVEEFARRTGRGFLGNKPASGTAVLDEYGSEHVRTGHWIVYTSADSVFQVAAHEGTVPLAELYAACAAARELFQGEHAVSRIIARPFVGEPVPGGALGTAGISACPHQARLSWTDWPSGRFPGWAWARLTIFSPAGASPAFTPIPTPPRMPSSRERFAPCGEDCCWQT